MWWRRLKNSWRRYGEREGRRGDPAIIGDRIRYTQAAKEHGSLAKMVKPYLEYQQIGEAIAQAETLLAAEADPAMRSYLEEELAAQRQQQQTLHTGPEGLVVVEPREKFGSVIME